MPTPLDKALNSKNTFLGEYPDATRLQYAQLTLAAFTGIVTAVAAWSIWGQDMFPKEADPTGDPETWTYEEMRRWLAVRNLHPNSKDTREQLLERVKANLRTPRA